MNFLIYSRFKIAVLVVVLYSGTILGQAIDNHIKALFVFNFSRYMEWPDEWKKGDFIIGILDGDEALVKEFVKSCEVKKVGFQQVTVRNIKTFEEAKYCHVVFVPTNSTKRIDALSHAVTGKPVLVVSETMAAKRYHSSVNLFHDNKDGGTKFELNKKLLLTKGIRVENSLEALAASVY